MRITGADPNLPLRTRRLTLRWPESADAPAIERHLAGAEVAERTASIPHPYPEGGASDFLASARFANTRGDASHMVIIENDTDVLIGFVSIVRDLEAEVGRLGYWVGAAHWGHGYATEAVGAIILHAATRMGLSAIAAEVFPDNTESINVLTKNGFVRVAAYEKDFPVRGGRRTVERWEREV